MDFPHLLRRPVLVVLKILIASRLAPVAADREAGAGGVYLLQPLAPALFGRRGDAHLMLRGARDDRS